MLLLILLELKTTDNGICNLKYLKPQYLLLDTPMYLLALRVIDRISVVVPEKQLD